MFLCYKCKNFSRTNEPQNKLVIETRPVTYTETYTDVDDEGNPVIVKGKILGSGFETVKEVNICKNCL